MCSEENVRAGKKALGVSSRSKRPLASFRLDVFCQKGFGSATRERALHRSAQKQALPQSKCAQKE